MRSMVGARCLRAVATRAEGGLLMGAASCSIAATTRTSSSSSSSAAATSCLNQYRFYTPSQVLCCPATAAAPSSPATTPSASSAPSTVDFFTYRTEVADKLAAKYRPVNVSVSQRCFDNIKRVNRLEGLSCSDRFLRLSIESGGCQGFSYKFDFDTEVNDAKGIEKARAAGKEVDDAEEDDVADIRFYPTVSASDEEAVAAAKEEAEKNVPFVVVDTETLKKLQSATLDYHSELKGSAFVVIGNELVDHSCACAMSFAIKSPAK